MRAHGFGIALAHVEMPFARGLLLWQRCRTLVSSVVDSFDALVSRLGLQPHPEGGWYKELQRSSIQVTRPDGEQRSAITTVLFLLGADDVSRWHCVHGGDEIWTFLGGAPLSLFQHPDDANASDEDVLSADQPVACVPAGVWMAARSQGEHSLVSCCVGPGFSFDDFEMLRDRVRSRWPMGIDEALL